MLTRCVALLARGLLLSAQLRRLLQLAVALHSSLAVPVSSARLEQLSHGLCLLKVRARNQGQGSVIKLSALEVYT